MTVDLESDPIDLGVCDCCGEEPAVGVAAVPYVPISITWGSKCLQAGIIPYWVAVANTAVCGGLDQTNDDWKQLVKITLKYFGKTDEEFAADVVKDIALFEEKEGSDGPSDTDF
jgi:hypothetical protein